MEEAAVARGSAGERGLVGRDPVPGDIGAAGLPGTVDPGFAGPGTADADPGFGADDLFAHPLGPRPGSAELPSTVPAKPVTGTGITGERAERLGLLLVRAQSSDREALHAIVAELTPLLWNVARGQGLDHADAEDVVQTVWLSLVARLTRIDTPTALVAWLATACRRESWRSRSARDRARALEPERLAELADLAELTSTAAPAERAEERVLADERMRVVRSALDRLSPRCAELLRTLALVERPDYTVVARALGMPRGSIGPTRGRCLAKLRAQLQADAGWSAVCP